MDIVEKQCRRICTGQEPPVDPDALAAPGKFNPHGKFTNWQVYEYVGMGEPLTKFNNLHDPGKKERQAYIARMIEESNPGQDLRYKYHTQKY